MLAGNVFEATIQAPPGRTPSRSRRRTRAATSRSKSYQVDVAATGASYSYDATGNLTQKVDGADTWAYEWNAESQLKRVAKNGAEVARFSYDPRGRRVEKVAGGVTTSYLYDGSDILREARGAATLKYVHGPGHRRAARARGRLRRADLLPRGRARQHRQADEPGGRGGPRSTATTPGATSRSARASPATPSREGSGIRRSGSTTTELGTDPQAAGSFRGSDWPPWGQRLTPYVHNDPVERVDPLGLLDSARPRRLGHAGCAPSGRSPNAVMGCQDESREPPANARQAGS